jgi:MFS family permease
MCSGKREKSGGLEYFVVTRGKLTRLRASYFSYISSTSYVVSFLGPTLAAFTMSKSLWLPFWINIFLLLCAIPTVGLLPSASKAPAIYTVPDSISQENNEEAGPLLQGRSDSSERHADEFEVHPGILQSIAHAIRRMRRLITGRRKFQVLLCSFFLTALASSDTKLLVQYISKRYEWTFAQVCVLATKKRIHL